MLAVQCYVDYCNFVLMHTYAAPKGSDLMILVPAGKRYEVDQNQQVDMTRRKGTRTSGSVSTEQERKKEG